MKTDLVLKDVPTWFASAVAALAAQVQADPRFYEMQTGALFGCASNNGDEYIDVGVILEATSPLIGIRMCGLVRATAMYSALQIGPTPELGTTCLAMGEMMRIEARGLSHRGIGVARGGQPT